MNNGICAEFIVNIFVECNVLMMRRKRFVMVQLVIILMNSAGGLYSNKYISVSCRRNEEVTVFVRHYIAARFAPSVNDLVFDRRSIQELFVFRQRIYLHFTAVIIFSRIDKSAVYKVGHELFG